MKTNQWNVKVLDVRNGNVLEEHTYPTIKDISAKYNKICHNTWRNICLGRSKLYEPFFKVQKIKM